MLNTDARASALITFINDLDDDTRLGARDREILTAYRTKLASAPTSLGEDFRMVFIIQKFFQKINNC